MQQTDLEILSRFEEVWQRVQHGRRGETEQDFGGIESVMDGLHYQWRGCRQLAFCTCGRERACLIALSERIKKQFQSLQLHYYLETGDIYCSDASPSFASYTPYNLRKLWQTTVKNVEAVKKCNLNGNLAFVAELRSMDTELDNQKTELEGLIKGLLQ